MSAVYDSVTVDPRSIPGAQKYMTNDKGDMMTDETYNGWTNYETWNVKLWIDNEQSTYYEVTGHATEVYAEADGWTTADKYDFADWLKEYVTDNMLPEDIRGLASDLLNAAMSEVSWSEIAEAYLNDAEENSAPASE